MITVYILQTITVPNTEGAGAAVNKTIKKIFKAENRYSDYLIDPSF